MILISFAETMSSQKAGAHQHGEKAPLKPIYTVCCKSRLGERVGYEKYLLHELPQPTSGAVY